MRVVHLGKYYPPSVGGIEAHTQALALSQAALGADVRVVVTNHAVAGGRDVTFDHLTPTPPAEETDGPIRITRVGRWANVAKLDVAPGLSGLIRRRLHDPPDIWHLHAPNVTMMLAVLATPRIRPLVVTHHSDIVRQRVLRQVVRPVENAVYQRAARVLATSASYTDGSDLLRQFAPKVTSVPLGIDQTPFRRPSAKARNHADQLRRAYGVPLWLCVGRLIYYKGLHVAIEALRHLPGKLLIVGTGPLGGELKRLAAVRGVTDRIAWHGRASEDELVGAYHAATALWFPSVARSEGFGLVQVEAMASGCPVVNTSIPGSGVAWVCRHEREGLTVSVGDPTALAAAASRLLTEPGLRDQLGAAGRQRAASEFDHRVMARRTLDVYRAVIG